MAGGDGNVLHQYVQQTISPDACSAAYSDGQVTDNEMCAGVKGPCLVSGSPLVCKQGDSWYQHGVGSISTECGQRPGIYSSVVEFLPWIKKHTESQYL